MPAVRVAAASILAALLLAACAAHRPPAPRATAPLLRIGPERTSIPYDDPQAAAKQALLDRINRDRADAGAPPVAYDPRLALAGDLFCLDAALAGTRGHFDLQGRAPYLRWALDGGIDYHAENAAMYQVSSGRVDRPLLDILLRIHDSMMDEQPPLDGHRRTVLDPAYTHAGIGLGVAGGELRMTEEFSTVAFEWVEVPAGPLLPGEWAAFRGRTLPQWEVGLVEIRHEPAPRPLGLDEARRRLVYSYPRVVRTLHPRLARGAAYDDGTTGDVDVGGGVVALEFPLDQGPGHYYLLAYVRPAGRPRDPLRPATAVLVTAG
jgi:uncharacterized protein YkwD